MWPRGLAIGVALVLLGAAPALAEDEPRVKLSTSVNYSIGDYGTGKDTTIVYVPFTLGVRPFDRFWLSVTIPFIYQDTQNVVLTGGGGRDPGRLRQQAPQRGPVRVSHPGVHVHRRPAGRGFPQFVRVERRGRLHAPATPVRVRVRRGLDGHRAGAG